LTKLTKVELAGRNMQILRMYQRGMTFAAIGRRMNLSRERIRQIVRKLEAP
jgi:DNA-directed RNA polymerase sigma subunit (sigma70/sigma32)